MASIHEQSIPVMIKYLGNISKMLNKAIEHSVKTGTKQEDMLQFKLTPEGRPLSYYIQGCSNTPKFLAARVGGHENIYFPDDETSFDQLVARIAKTIDILKAVDPKVMNEKHDQPILMEAKYGTFKFRSGQAYVSEFAMANFHGVAKFTFEGLQAQGVDVTMFDLMAGVVEKA